MPCPRKPPTIYGLIDKIQTPEFVEKRAFKFRKPLIDNDGNLYVSRASAAKHFGVSHPTISKWVLGQSPNKYGLREK